MALIPVGGKYKGVWFNKLKNGNISYYINYRDGNGNPRRTLVGKKTNISDFTAKDAYAKLIEIKYKLQHGEEPTLKHSRVRKIKLDDLWDHFLQHAKIDKDSWNMDMLNYNKHIKPVFGNRAVESLKALDFEKFKQKLFQEKYEPQTVKHQLGLIRSILNYAIKHELIKNFTNPISNGKVKMPKIDNKRLAFLTKEQAKLLLEKLKNLDLTTYHLTIILLFTGARFSEVTGSSSKKNKANQKESDKKIGLTWNEVDFQNNTIYFRKTKNGNDRYIYMNDKLLKTMKYLKKHTIGESNRVITTSKGGIILKMPHHFMTALEDIIPGNKKKNNAYKITAHSLRHTHASWLAQSGLDILQIQEQLGHKDLKMTLRYAHLIPNKRYEATKAIVL